MDKVLKQSVVKNKTCAYCTLVGTDSYVIGALCLAESYRRLNLPHDFIFLISSFVSNEFVERIASSNLGKCVYIDNDTWFNNAVFGCTSGKFASFKLVEYDKVIFLDADVILYDALDDLFKYKYWFSNYGSGRYCGAIFCVTPSDNLYNKFCSALKCNNFDNDEDVLCYLDIDTHKYNAEREKFLYCKLWHDCFGFGVRDTGEKYWHIERIDSYDDICAVVDHFIENRDTFKGFCNYVSVVQRDQSFRLPC